LKLVGTVVRLTIPGELLMVLNTILFAPGLQVRVSVALPDPSLAANEIVSGFSVQVTFGFVRVDEGRITAV